MCDSADFPLEYGLFDPVKDLVLVKSVIDIRTISRTSTRNSRN